MKSSYQILIIVVIALSLYIVRDDLSTIYNKATRYVVENIAPTVTKTKDNISFQSDKLTTLAKSIATPGALRATSNSNLVQDANRVKLSIKGVISFTNENRLANGNLPPLRENTKLNLSAQKKLDDMFAKQYFEHVSPSGVGVSDLGERVGYSYIIIGENLALGNFKDDKALVDAWMASPGHRANILNKHYTEIGVAVGHGMFEGQDIWLAVQHFGLPRSACPAIDEVLYGQITVEQNMIENLSDELAVRKEKIDSRVVYEGMTTNEQISKYNDLVAIYNQMIINIKEKISKYNLGIRAFNACLEASNS